MVSNINYKSYISMQFRNMNFKSANTKIVRIKPEITDNKQFTYINVILFYF